MEWLGATHQLIESTNQSKSAAENGDTNRSMVLMDQTIQTLNALARELLAKSGEMKKQMGQGSSMDQMLERLGQVSAMQQQLNQQMMKMPGMGSPGMMEMMQQLGDKQGQVQQELDKMMKEFRQFKEMNERLKDVMKEMEQVKKALQNGESGSRIRETQSRIMRRLLQLQTAMKKQDQDNKRKADKPKTFSPTVRPKALPESPLPYTMQELLQRLEREPYPKEYLHEIREYYRLLLDKQKSRQSF